MPSRPHEFEKAPSPACPDHGRTADGSREVALHRVCAGFTTTISPRSAARLAELLSTTTYVQAA